MSSLKQINNPDITISITSGASWTLTFEEQIDPETLSFSVGEDCPYYNNGYTNAKLHIKGILGIEVEGPGGELYVKLKQGTMLPDCDFEMNSCGWNDAVELNSTEYFRLLLLLLLLFEQHGVLQVCEDERFAAPIRRLRSTNGPCEQCRGRIHVGVCSSRQAWRSH